MPKNAKPAPVAVTTVCSLCGLDWQQHGADATTEDCIRLLKLELARRPTVINVPYVYGPYVYGPYWTCGASVWSSDTHSISETPRASAAAWRAVARARAST